MKIISIVNNKGGVGKTTTTQNLGVYFAELGFKVGLIDFDSQANLSLSFEYDSEGVDLLNALKRGEKLVLNDFSKVQNKSISVLYNNKDINSGTMGVVPEVKRLGALKRIINQLNFDIILIDTAPSLDINTLCPLFASTDILIPINYEKYSIQGLSTLFETIDILNNEQNANINTLGVFATKVDERLAITEAYRPILEKELSEYLLKSVIRTNSKFQQSQDSAKSIFDLEDLKGKEDYKKLGDEILAKLKLTK
ncbi:MAG: ParA family protein [Patescibacteria group bacterium]